MLLHTGKRKRERVYSSCSVGVVYKNPLSRGCFYVGQAGRCVNDRMCEHANSLRGAASGHLAIHCNMSGCQPV